MGAGTFTATASTDGHRRLRNSRGRGNGGEDPNPLRVKTARPFKTGGTIYR